MLHRGRRRRQNFNPTMFGGGIFVLLLFLVVSILQCDSSDGFVPFLQHNKQERFLLLQQNEQPKQYSNHQDDMFVLRMSGGSNEQDGSNGKQQQDNKAMAFLKRIGKVGGEANRDFSKSIGVDEGPSGKFTHTGREGGVGVSAAATAATVMKKSQHAYKPCTESGIIDDMSEIFPTTSCGTSWSGFTDRVMGGVSTGVLTREMNFCGRTANVLRGTVSLKNNGGFIQMATNLLPGSEGGGNIVGGRPLTTSSVADASSYDGIELDVACHVPSSSLSKSSLEEEEDQQQQPKEQDEETFNIHLKTSACIQPFSSYRATFHVTPTQDDEWTSIRIPWNEFRGHGPGASDAPFDASQLKRIGIVSIGKETKVELGVSNLCFYRK